jgi:hypothetical protein
VTPSPDSIELAEDDLRPLARWAAECAERALPVFSARAPDDDRPRDALDGCRAFADGARRSNRLRSLVWGAYAAAREVGDPAAAAAARAAGLSAGVAYTHRVVDREQTKHLLGPAAYAALACELAKTKAADAAAEEVRRAVACAPAEVVDVMRRLPDRGVGRGRVEALMHAVYEEFASQL